MTDHSSQSSALPEGVNPSELYDGPAPGQAPTAQVVPHPAALIQPIPAPAPPPPVTTPEEESRYAEVLSAALDVLSARLLGLLALLAACAIWGFAVWDPTTARTIAAGLFSVTVLAPIIAIYWKAG